MDSRLQKILNDIAEKHAIKNPSFVCTYETGKGEGYIGIVKMFEITEKNEKHSKRLNLIIKQSPQADEIRARLPVRKLFLTEIRFYSKIAKYLNDFQVEHGTDCFQFANCHYSEETPRQEILIIENLQATGYDVIDRTVPMKYAHMKLAFEELAKLHAVSFALKHKKPLVYAELIGTLFDNVMLQLYNQMGFDNFINKLASNCKRIFEGTNMYDKYCTFFERVVEEYHQSNIPDEYSTISHGDSWCNNILYSHDASGLPTSAILIDYQMCRVHSPVLDLSYLFYGCADVELLPRLNEFLNIYYQTVKKCLAMFELDVENVYPWTKLLEHWKRYSKYGFIVSFLMRVLMLSTADESPDLSLAAKKDGDVMMAFLYKMKREHEYNETMKAIVKHYIDEKFL